MISHSSDYEERCTLKVQETRTSIFLETETTSFLETIIFCNPWWRVRRRMMMQRGDESEEKKRQAINRVIPRMPQKNGRCLQRANESQRKYIINLDLILHLFRRFRKPRSKKEKRIILHSTRFFKSSFHGMLLHYRFASFTLKHHLSWFLRQSNSASKSVYWKAKDRWVKQKHILFEQLSDALQY
jgi:hypothetical protein